MATPTLRAPYGVSSPYTVDDPGVLKNPFGLGTGGGGGTGPQGPTGPSGHGSTTTTAAPTLVSGNWRFTVADTTAFNAFGLPIYCGDGTNSIRGTVYNVLSSTQLDIAPDSTSGTVSAIANGSTFTFSGVQGPAGGGGGGAMTKIAKVVTSGSQSSVVFSSIPQTYSNLLLCFQGRSTDTGGGEVVCYCKINGDGTSGNYSGGTYSGFISTAASSNFGTVAATANGACIGVAPGTSGNANAVGQFTCNFINYAGTAFYKNWQSVYTDFFGAGSAIDTGNLSGVYKSTSAINSITLTLGSGNFVDGSTVVLYGIS